VAGVVNLNQASLVELHLLPGVGAKAAESILEYRKQHPFTRAEELVKVKGFGKRRFEHLRPYLVVQGATTLHRVT
jgi:competence protein ComEA